MGTLLSVAIVAGAHMSAEELQGALQAEVTRHPQDPTALHNLAKAYQTAGRWDEALVAFDDAIAQGADRDECDAGRGQVLLTAGFPRLARRTFDAVVARRPDAYGVMVDRAHAWMAVGEPEKAAEDYGRALPGLARLTPENVLAHRDAWLAAHKPAEALHALDQGMSRLGPVASLQLAAIDLESDRQQWAGALERLDQLLRQAPKSEAWIVRRGELLERLGRADDARLEFEKARTLIAARPPGRRNQALNDLDERIHSHLNIHTTQHKGER